jgi:hypothetical protein
MVDSVGGNGEHGDEAEAGRTGQQPEHHCDAEERRECQDCQVHGSAASMKVGLIARRARREALRANHAE